VLQKRIRDLEVELARAREQIDELEETKVVHEVEYVDREVIVFDETAVAGIAGTIGEARADVGDALAKLDQIKAFVAEEVQKVENLVGQGAGSAKAMAAVDRVLRARERGAQPGPPPPRPPSNGKASLNGDVTPARQRVLDALAWFATVGIDAPTRAALAPLAGSKATSGGFKNNLGALRTAGLIDYPQPNAVTLTAEGHDAANWPEAPGTSAELQAAVLATLTPARQRILEELIDAYPNCLSRDSLAAHVGVPTTSGGFKNNLGAMRTQGVIDYPQQGAVIAADLLFLHEEASHAA
jgi:hypothetical protein